ncbi:hypothetical protein H4I96_02632 [Botrytis cinerea]
MLDVCVAGQNFASPSASQILTDPNRLKGTRCSHWESFYHIYR